jgi:hypothetical protein
MVASDALHGSEIRRAHAFTRHPPPPPPHWHAQTVLIEQAVPCGDAARAQLLHDELKGGFGRNA